MDEFKVQTDMDQGASLIAGARFHARATIRQFYKVECVRDGKLIWTEEFENIVVTAGLNKYLDATLKTGLAAPAWYVGIVTGPGAGNTYALADIMSDHGGWLNDTTYSEATRPAFTPGVISGGSVNNSASKAVFSINGTATIAGCFLVDENTKTGATGTLLGVGNFTTGDRSVLNGDTLNVTVTCTLS